MQSIIRHNHSEMNEFSGLLRIRNTAQNECVGFCRVLKGKKHSDDI